MNAFQGLVRAFAVKGQGLKEGVQAVGSFKKTVQQLRGVLKGLPWEHAVRASEAHSDAQASLLT